MHSHNFNITPARTQRLSILEKLCKSRENVPVPCCADHAAGKFTVPKLHKLYRSQSNGWCSKWTPWKFGIYVIVHSVIFEVSIFLGKIVVYRWSDATSMLLFVVVVVVVSIWCTRPRCVEISSTVQKTHYINVLNWLISCDHLMHVSLFVRASNGRMCVQQQFKWHISVVNTKYSDFLAQAVKWSSNFKTQLRIRAYWSATYGENDK